MERWLAACGWAGAARRAILQDRGQRHRLRPAGGRQPGLTRSSSQARPQQAERLFSADSLLPPSCDLNDPPPPPSLWGALSWTELKWTEAPIARSPRFLAVLSLAPLLPPPPWLRRHVFATEFVPKKKNPSFSPLSPPLPLFPQFVKSTPPPKQKSESSEVEL